MIVQWTPFSSRMLQWSRVLRLLRAKLFIFEESLLAKLVPSTCCHLCLYACRAMLGWLLTALAKLLSLAWPRQQQKNMLRRESPSTRWHLEWWGQPWLKQWTTLRSSIWLTRSPWKGLHRMILFCGWRRRDGWLVFLQMLHTGWSCCHDQVHRFKGSKFQYWFLLWLIRRPYYLLELWTLCLQVCCICS